MPQFFDLPRELRDMVYLEVITSARSRPTLKETETESGWNRPWEPKSGLGDHGCAFSAKRAPSTCANFLVCSRQINAEMMHAIERARRKGLSAARMDCIAKDEMHYFSWLSIPLVKTVNSAHDEKKGIMPNWAARYLTAPRALVRSNGGNDYRKSTTVIEQLCIDIRLLESDSTTRNVVEAPRDRTSWAICAALKHVFEHDPEIIPTRDCQNDISVDEVILNVISPPRSAPAPSKAITQPSSTSTNIGSEADKENAINAESVAKELVDVWNKLWSGDEFKARYYRRLLERIQRVRICVDGKTFRVRELRVELERGRAEKRRIEMRMR